LVARSSVPDDQADRHQTPTENRAMTTYTYRLLNTDGTDGKLVEIDQPFAAAALTHHPETGHLIRRTIECGPNIGGRWSDRASVAAMSAENLARNGFSRYQPTGDGCFEKECGPGPDLDCPSCPLPT
jgi:hypothetical protein